MNNSNKNNKIVKNEGIKNPTSTTLGKVVIWILLGAMVLSPIIGLVFMLLN